MDTFGVIEAAEFLKVNDETMRRIASNGEVYGARIGHAWVFFKTDLGDYLHKQTLEQTERRRAEKGDYAPKPLELSPPAPRTRRGRPSKELPELPTLPELSGKITAS